MMESEECISLNLALLEKSGLIEKGSQDYKLSISAKKLLLKLVCNMIEHTHIKDTGSELAPQVLIKRLAKDKSVLILVHYGSSSRGKGDRLSDIDLLAITRDKISRGDILARYSHKGIDLSVYSKSGFLQLLKSQPDFISNISMARILKGRDILHAVTHGN